MYHDIFSCNIFFSLCIIGRKNRVQIARKVDGNLQKTDFLTSGKGGRASVRQESVFPIARNGFGEKYTTSGNRGSGVNIADSISGIAGNGISCADSVFPIAGSPFLSQEGISPNAGSGLRGCRQEKLYEVIPCG